MAKPKNETAPATAPEKKSLLASYAEAEGFDEKDIKLTGQLPPQYLGKPLLEWSAANSNAPIQAAIGIFSHVEVLPLQKRQTRKGEEIFAPFSMVLHDLREPVIAFRGKEGEREEVPVAKGGSVLVAITSQTSVNREVMDMIRDPNGVYLVAVLPTGSQKVNDQPSEMVTWQIEVVKLKGSRAELGAKYAWSTWYQVVIADGSLVGSIRNGEHEGLLKVAATDGVDVISGGVIINRKTGEPLKRLTPTGTIAALPAASEVQQPQASQAS